MTSKVMSVQANKTKVRLQKPLTVAKLIIGFILKKKECIGQLSDTTDDN